MIDLAAPWWLVALPIPTLWLAWLRYQQRRQHTASTPALALAHPQTDLLLRLSTLSRTTPWRTHALWLCGVTLLTASLAQPRWLVAHAPEHHNGRDILLLLDISGSMRAEDFTLHDRQVNRIEVLKQSVNALLDQSGNDRYGIIVFGDDVYTLAPLTHDKSLLKQFVKELAPGIAGEKTALGDALLAGIARLRSGRGAKTLVMFTDGSRTAGVTAPLEALAIAKTEQVRIFTVGIGSNDEVMVPRGVRNTPALTDMPLDESLLQQLATATGGRYVAVREANSIRHVAAALRELPPSDRTMDQPTSFINLTWLPLTLGLALVMAQRLWQHQDVAP